MSRLPRLILLLLLCHSCCAWSLFDWFSGKSEEPKQEQVRSRHPREVAARDTAWNGTGPVPICSSFNFAQLDQCCNNPLGMLFTKDELVKCNRLNRRVINSWVNDVMMNKLQVRQKNNTVDVNYRRSYRSICAALPVVDCIFQNTNISSQSALNDTAAKYYFLLDNFVEGDLWVDIMFEIFAPFENMAFKDAIYPDYQKITCPSAGGVKKEYSLLPLLFVQYLNVQSTKMCPDIAWSDTAIDRCNRTIEAFNYCSQLMFAQIVNQTAIGISLDIKKKDEMNLPIPLKEFEDDYDYLMAEDYDIK